MALLSQRNIIVLLPRILELLVAQHGQRPRDALARRMRHDHLVDIAALGGDEGRQKALLIFGRTLGDLGRIVDIGAEDDLDRALGAHHLQSAPSARLEIDVAAQMF